jgi:hypothetical protein
MDKFVAYWLNGRAPRKYDYEAKGLTELSLNTFVSQYPLWVKWIDTQDFIQAGEFFEALSFIIPMDERDWQEIQSTSNLPLVIKPPEDKEKFQRNALAELARLSRIINDNPPFST